MKSYAEKLRACNREAAMSVAALVATVLVWAVCGFGLAHSSVRVFGTPLWVVCGTLGTWAFAIAAAVVLSRFFFSDFSLDEGEGLAVQAEGEGPGVQAEGEGLAVQAPDAVPAAQGMDAVPAAQGMDVAPAAQCVDAAPAVQLGGEEPSAQDGSEG